VPGRAVATIDVRHADDAIRHRAVERLRDAARAIAARRELDVTWEQRLDNPAVDVDPLLTEHLAASIVELGRDVHRMASGAGHDGVAIADLTGIAMLFVRCASGLSHHPGESVAAADVAVALDVLDGFLRRLAAT
jgi:allantoate deiminase